MIKIFNKFFYYVKNIILPILMVATIYIVLMMFQRLGKEPFGANFLEFIEVIIPYILLVILLLINTFLKQDEVRNSFFYNVTSFLVIMTIFVFCYRAIFDKNLILWHKLKYDIDFNYFTDQIAPMKTMLYLLSAANIMLIIKGCLKEDKNLEIASDNIKVDNKEDNFKEEDAYKDYFNTETMDDDYNYISDNTSLEETEEYTLEFNKDNSVYNNDNENKKNNNNNNSKKNYYNNKNKKNNYYKNNKNNNYYKNNNYKQNKKNQNNNNNKPKKTFDFYE